MIGVLDKDSTFLFSFDQKDLHKNGNLSVSSVMEIGGLTKIFTAHLCYKLAAKNVIDLHIPISSYLSGITAPTFQHITIEHLLTHTSGLPARPHNLSINKAGDRNIYANYTKHHLLKFLSELPNKKEVPAAYFYSHLNYALIEIILERHLGSTFKTILAEELLISSSLDQTSLDTPENIAQGFDRAGRHTVPWSFASFAASEGLRSTLRDLAIYTRRILDKRIDSSILDQMLTPKAKIPGTKKTHTSGGWHLFKNRRLHDIYLHSGKTDGHAASIHFVQDTSTAVILMTNSTFSMNGLSTLILRMINNNWKSKNG